MSLRLRIQLIVIGAVVIAFAAAGVVIVVAARAQLVDRIDDNNLETADALADVAGRLGTEIVVASLADLSTVVERSEATLIIDARGEVALALASGTNDDSDPLPQLGRSVGELRDGRGGFTVDAVEGRLRYRVVAVSLPDGGVAVVASPLDGVQQLLASLVLTLAAAGAAVITVVAVVIVLASRRAMRPVNEMIEAAGAIGSGDLSRRIPTPPDPEEARQLGDALNNMLRQLETAFAEREASDARLRRFVADASHELRTPLTSIRGYAELYLTGLATDEAAVDKAMTRIRAEAVRTGDLVNDLLLLARLDQGRPLATEAVSLSRIVADATEDLRAVQPDRAVTVDADPEVWVTGDEARLRQVVTNLLANTRIHAGDTPVEVRLGIDGDHAVLAIADHGPGMTAEQAGQVFDRFWRAADSRDRKHGGTGLGLSIVDLIVRAHHGTIGLDTEPGRGATFTVSLPLDLRLSTARP